VVYRTGQNGRGPVAIDLNGTSIEFSREANPYRPGAVRVGMDELERRLTDAGDRLTILLG
jgi:hypothetical protein